MPITPNDPDTIGFLLTDVSRLFRARIDQLIAEAGIGMTAGEARTLIHAARLGQVRQNVLAEHMGVEAMTVSSYLDRLEANGFIERVPDPDDRRAKLVHLTGTSEHALEQIRTISLGLRAEVAKTIPPDQWALLIAMLKTVRSNLYEQASAINKKTKDGDE
ncbi:MAG: MarR family winged helix-turn-helix transcriptional regulator [Phyllobacterium sp.]